jgi:hypothetical protein
MRKKNAKAPYAIARGHLGQPTMRTTRRGAGGCLLLSWSLATGFQFIFGVPEFYYLSAAGECRRPTKARASLSINTNRNEVLCALFPPRSADHEREQAHADSTNLILPAESRSIWAIFEAALFKSNRAAGVSLGGISWQPHSATAAFST